MTRKQHGPLTTLVATAGHVDHGKTSLVRALTGIDTDRLPEEKAREISIECGFAHTVIDGRPLTFVDVPGHERFIRQMVGGVSGMDVVLLVIAVDDGPMPQTLEHLDICIFIGVPRVVVALSRSDLADPEWTALMAVEIEGLLATTPWPDAPIIPCSAVNGEGLPELRAALVAAGSNANTAADSARARRPFAMPIDRIFSAQGFGTIVTGTSAAGEVRPGDTVVVAPVAHGGDGLSRVRAVERQGEKVDVGGPLQRLALNLSDLPREALSRGAMVFSPGHVRVGVVIEALLHLSRALEAPLRRGQTVTVQAGLATADARIIPLEDTPLEAGAAIPVELRLDRPIATIDGMPFVIRGFERLAGRGLTLGGGRITSGRDRPVSTRRHPARAALVRAFARSDAMAAIAAHLDDADLEGASIDSLSAIVAAMPVPALPPPSWPDVVREGAMAFAERAFKRFTGALVEHLRAFHARDPGEAGFPIAELGVHLTDALGGRPLSPELVERLVTASVAAGHITRSGGIIALPGFVPMTPAMENARQDALSALLLGAGLMPPWRDTLADAIAAQTGLPHVSAERYIQRGLRSGEYVRVDVELIYHRDAIELLLRALDDHFATHDTLSVGQLKDVTGASRKWAMPLVAWLDKERYTSRKGDERTRHPRWQGPFVPKPGET